MHSHKLTFNSLFFSFGFHGVKYLLVLNFHSVCVLAASAQYLLKVIRFEQFPTERLLSHQQEV